MLCLGGPYGRLNSEIGVTTSSGTAEYRIDLLAIPLGTGFVAAAAGEDWNTQLWYRDGAVSNTTRGLSIAVR